MLLVYSAVADHGVPEQLLDDTMAAQRAFFSLPLEQKMRIAVNKYYRCALVGVHEGQVWGHLHRLRHGAQLPNQWMAMLAATLLTC